MANENLTAARRARNDEFYTQWADIEREMNAYLEYDPDVFRDKVILLPCDDPEWSNFAKFFALHFMDFGLKKLISTSYAPDSNPAGRFYQTTLFETEDPRFDAAKTRANGKVFTLESKDINEDAVINIEDLQWDYLEGDGDFRSAEVTALRDEADIVITNPPFSLFGEFLDWLVKGEKTYSIIGNSNATTYKDVFPLIQNNKMWKGATANSSDMVFGVPKGFDVAEADRLKAERLGYPSDDRYDYTRLGNSCWFTNLEHGRRHQPLQLMTMADNIKYSNHKEIRGVGYQRYDNYDAIEVPYVDAIPIDYDGMMGVPITFLDKYNPDQFEIVGTLESSDPDNPGRTRWYTAQDQKDAYFRRFGTPGTIPLNMSGVVNDVKVLIAEKIRGDCGHAFMRPVLAPVNPTSPAPVIARMLKDRVSSTLARGADKIVVLLDREDLDACPGDLARAIQEAMATYTDAQICVVIKDRKFENWLVADIDSLAGMRARFRVTEGQKADIRRRGADSVDAHQLLRRAAQGPAYEKVRDSRRILAAARAEQMAANSRSFRRFLRCVHHPSYETQSRLAAAGP